MHYQLEPPKCQTSGSECPHVRVLRGYRNKGDEKYFGTSIVIERENGLWEPTAWQTDSHPPKGYQIEGMRFLEGKGYKISGTFDTKHLAAYRRMFRGYYNLDVIKVEKKTYNGVEHEFALVRFVGR